MILSIVFALSPIIINKLNLSEGDSDKSLEYNEDSDLDNCKLKFSKISGKIHIDNNWTAAKSAGIVTGNGIFSDPYVIEDLVIDGGFSSSPILIENSNVHFKIINCTVYNSAGAFPHTAGIVLNNVTNANLIDNNCSNNARGISLHFSHNNTITANTANNNRYKGIYVWKSDNNIFSRNILRFNSEYGLSLDNNCNNNNISSNTVNDNLYYGISIYNYCNYTIISGNIAKDNRIGISLQNCDNSIVLDNIVNYNTHIGIYLRESGNNTISGNTVNNNQEGIKLYVSNDNTISGNILIGNEVCIVEDNCQGNTFSNNGACTYGQSNIIPGYNLFFLLGILSVVLIILSKRLKKF